MQQFIWQSILRKVGETNHKTWHIILTIKYSAKETVHQSIVGILIILVPFSGMFWNDLKPWKT